ncbi:heme-binding protein [Urbifossiella limnaea]|uniref:FG-GAP repeat protein n=1 Tax=Urbifossiella limnaea TaxID=2528023 RepID=A0A517XPI0_9BACT|nr:heme-binding protein [Urbifossiella limnaea]QDU19419.1 FG-GAP repeat protein [Urbifossiella limnaea]
MTHHPQRHAALRVEVLERRDQPAVVAPNAIPFGAMSGAVPDVSLIDPATTAVVGRVRAYEDTFAGGVRAAVGDLNGDGAPEVVTGPGPGGGPRVVVVDGATGLPVASFLAYEPSFAGGVDVAVGDLDGDGRPEIITGAGNGGGPLVKVFDVLVDPVTQQVTGAAQRDAFFAYEEAFRGGVFVAAGDLDGDGRAEMVLGTGVGGGPRVRAVRGTPDHAEVLNIFAYEDTSRHGVRVAAGDLDGDGRTEVVTGTGSGSGPRVRLLSGLDGSELASFFAFDPATRTGVTVGVTAGQVVAWPTVATDTPVRRFDLGGARLGEAVVPFDPIRTPLVDAAQQTLAGNEVDALLARAAAASASSDAIIAVVDRNGRILGVRVEGRVAAEVTTTPEGLVFAVDGAVSKARTGAFFGNNQAPLTSRTVQFISQSTITEREVNSNPSVTDPNSTVRGPGFVAPVGIAGHFPPGIAFTPQVDLFGIEHTNRDGTYHVGPDRIKGTADDVRLAERFNADPAFVPAGQSLAPPDSYGFETRLARGAQNRGVATLPGGVPVFKNGQVVGGVGVFFPGRTGFATEENSALSTTYNPALPDRSLEAEWVAVAAVGGYATQTPVGPLGGVPLPFGFGLPFGRIDLVGITLDIVGPGGPFGGLDAVLAVGNAVGRGSPADGTNRPVAAGPDGLPNTADDVLLRAGAPVPEGWLVRPHDGVGVTRAEVEAAIANGLAEATLTRAAIRLPLGSRTRMVFAVTDLTGEVVGLYRMPDATVFSIDVAVAKARNVTYYADPAKLQPADQVPGLPAGVAFTNRTFRYLSLPHFPEGIDGAPPGPFSQLLDGGADPLFARTVGAPLPASAYRSVLGYDAFNPGTNFRDPTNVLNQNGVVFFPGSAPLYRGSLIGGLGVSGDGVDQDDVVTAGGAVGFDVPPTVLRADQVFVAGVRLPYQKFNRNPQG